MIAIITSGLGFFVLAGCGSSNNVTAPYQSAAAEAAATSEYIIGPGDTLNVFVWEHPDVSVTLPVRPDGRISAPLVEDMKVVGKTQAQLAQDMESALSEYIRSPTVDIIVMGFVGTFTECTRVHALGLKSRLRHYTNLRRTEGRLQRLLPDFRWNRFDALLGLRGA